ncbi:BON domain-containing protein [Mycobacterium sp.]|uniref:BON domain-containing protein n=1 Tax=Mycobacterium sp. TaxID=1785 RepID=UPI002CD349BA|nr:BON domain-containing protein [Mycobacterium sp.]HTY35053.1 BON domain-containing protein [Mycobacterium sp.]
MKTDQQLEKDVRDELRWEPSVTSAEVGVTVSQGVVTLNGTVPTYAEKSAAEKAAQRVAGVKAVADEIRVEPHADHRRNDQQIAQDAVRAVQSHVWVPTGIQVTVDNGWVTLRGKVTWEYQRKAAYDAVRFLPGVVGVSNEITIKATVRPSGVKEAIETALKRDAEIDAEGITVRADDGKVTLSGTVPSWAERDEAGSAAWRAPGVTDVQNELVVSY